ncbi:MAG: hypothetical protein HY721_13395 [Planctomycetes bacterium]|nr:hypothetical protein [Planctomycetota bacterium]
MAEMRRPQRPAAARSSGGGARRPVPQRKTSPWYMWVGLVGSPIVLIMIVLSLRGGNAEKVEATKPKVVDENRQVIALEKRIGAFQAGVRDAVKLVQSEDPSAKKKVDELKAQIDGWIDEWDGIFEKLEDPEGNLPPEYKKYRQTRAKVNQLRLDLLKISGL